MTDKEKLLQLINESGACFECFPCSTYVKEEQEKIADHLIANGVTVSKRGHWIIKSSGHGKNATNWAECSECRVCGSPQWKVCPVCETKMEKHSAINIEEVEFDYAAEDDNA